MIMTDKTKLPMSETTPLIDEEGMKKAMKLSTPTLKVALYLLRITHLNKVYQASNAPDGFGVIRQCIDNQNIRMRFSEEDLQHIPKSGPFIVIGNHPFGFLDGIQLLSDIGSKRPHFKVTANFLLGFILPLKNHFITVNPFEDAGPKNLKGSEQVLNHLAEGHGVGIYPAGEVSTYYDGKKHVEDKEWGLSAIKLIQKANVPVIPAYVHGINSPSFHWLGKLNPLLRTLRIPVEFLKKTNKHVPVSMDPAISAEEIQKFDDIQELSDFLRKKVYQQADKFKGTPPTQ